MIGGRPARVIAQTVDHRIRRRPIGRSVIPSRRPPNHAPSACRSRTLSRVMPTQVPTYTGSSTTGRLRRASHTRLRALSR